MSNLIPIIQIQSTLTLISHREGTEYCFSSRRETQMTVGEGDVFSVKPICVLYTVCVTQTVQISQ